MTHFTDDEVNAYAAAKNLVPGTLLWASDVPLSEDAFRSGNKTGPGADFLRYKDLGKANQGGQVRIPAEETGSHVVNPGQGISLFIKRMMGEGMIHLGSSFSTSAPEKAALKKQYNPFDETSWWKIEKGQVLPSGLQLVFDGEPPGHCTLTVERAMTVQAFLSLVAQVHFESLGTDYYGILK